MSTSSYPLRIFVYATGIIAFLRSLPLLVARFDPGIISIVATVVVGLPAVIEFAQSNTNTSETIKAPKESSSASSGEKKPSRNYGFILLGVGLVIVLGFVFFSTIGTLNVSWFDLTKAEHIHPDELYRQGTLEWSETSEAGSTVICGLLDPDTKGYSYLALDESLSSDFRLSFDMKIPTSFPTSEVVIELGRSQELETFYSINFEYSGQISFYINDRNEHQELIYKIKPPKRLEQWQSIEVALEDGRTLRLTENGDEVFSKTLDRSFTPGTWAVGIGSWGASSEDEIPSPNNTSEVCFKNFKKKMKG